MLLLLVFLIFSSVDVFQYFLYLSCNLSWILIYLQVKIISFITVSLWSRHICLLVVVLLVLLLVLFTHFACWLGQHFFMWNNHVLFRTLSIHSSHPLNANSGPSPHNNQKYHLVFQKASAVLVAFLGWWWWFLPPFQIFDLCMQYNVTLAENMRSCLGASEKSSPC